MVGCSMDIVVAMFKSSPSHRWLPNSTTDPQRGLKVCSNDAFPFWTPKMLQKALSNERDVVKQIHHGFGRKQYGHSCGSLALQSSGGSSVAMFKNIPIHMWLPNSTTDPQRGLKICSNDAFPFWTAKMLQKALSNERDVVKKIDHGLGRKQYGYLCGFLALKSPSSVAMFKSTPIHRWIPNSTTDPQHGLKICSNDAFRFWTSKMLQKRLSLMKEMWSQKNFGKLWKENKPSCWMTVRRHVDSILTLLLTLLTASFFTLT